ncbi:RfbJ protein [Sphingobium lactosutens DS20]|uniref:RfbJ protein n=2 Tax=Sphingobium TaxID=165695 RepID=T0HVP6_9SPHN|nr:RfbJ protein [Sphingobium lactosutens DS20]
MLKRLRFLHGSAGAFHFGTGMADEILIMMRHGCRTHHTGHDQAMKEFPAVNSETGAAAPRVAVLLPCYNEAGAIVQTVEDFRRALPHADIYVFDNNSSDGSRELAAGAGAIVRRVAQQGKGHVVRRMFADVDADIYVMADGDATYEAAAAPRMVAAMLEDNLDMVVGSRRDEVEAAYRRGHRFGNWALTTLLKQLFGRSFTDILSGYRVFSRRFVKSFPVLSAGFEIETEMSVHALELAMPVAEVVTAYGARPEGSVSKLSTYRDGFRILRTIITLYRIERPILFFGIIAALLAVLGLALAAPLIVTYMETGLVPRFPTAILVTGLMILATLSAMCGLILDTVVRGRREVRLLSYLGFRAPSDYARP